MMMNFAEWTNLQGSQAHCQIVSNKFVRAWSKPQRQVVQVFECICLYNTEAGGTIMHWRLTWQVQEKPVDTNTNSHAVCGVDLMPKRLKIKLDIRPNKNLIKPSTYMSYFLQEISAKDLSKSTNSCITLILKVYKFCLYLTILTQNIWYFKPAKAEILATTFGAMETSSEQSSYHQYLNEWWCCSIIAGWRNKQLFANKFNLAI